MNPAQRRRARLAAARCSAAVAIGLASCTPLLVAAPPPGLERILVLPANNRTGQPLFVDAPGLLPSVFGERPRTTVADLFTREAALQLRARGFEVADPPAFAGTGAAGAPADAGDAARLAAKAAFDGAALYIEISRWDPDEHSRPGYVSAKVDLVLVDPTSAEPLWEARLPAKPIPAGMTGSVCLGYPVAVHDLLAEMTGNLRPPLPARSAR